MLRMTEIELALISNNDMYLFVEKGIREGTSYIAKRFSKANTKYMKCYDSKSHKYIELKYWVDVQRGQSYFKGRKCLFSLHWPPF